MASDLYVDLDRAGRLLMKILEEHDPLPSDVVALLEHAHDDVQEARGKPRERGRTPQYVGNFDVGDKVGIIVNAYTNRNSASLLVPDGMSTPWVRSAAVIRPPKHRSPNDLEPNVEGKPWFFTSDLPVATAHEVDATMHLELESDRREVFHMRGEHWSTWHEKNGAYWTVLTIFKEGA